LGIAVAVVGLVLVHAPALAQSAPAATTNTPATDAIGPRELQNFSLDGTVTRPADPPQRAPRTGSAAASNAAQTQPAQQGAGSAEARTAASPAPRRAAQSDRTADIRPRTEPAIAQGTPEPRPGSPSRTSITVDLPPVSEGPAATPAAAPQPGFASATDSAARLAPEHGLPLWPWLLAAVALGAGGAFLFWRRQHGREAFAGGPQADAFVAPEPAPRPRAAQLRPAPPAPPAPAGVVSTRLRPWIDIAFEPARCVVEDSLVTIEFDIGLFNSGSTAARDVLLEASLFNASPSQDQEIAAFFANPVGRGERIPLIPTLKGATLRPRVPFARDRIRVFEAAGRQLFVPLIAFNVLYRWGSASEGQTSAAYLVGRDTKSDKLAPFRLDLGARIFRGLDSRALPLATRT
jgi:hypothetical protein